MGADQTSRNVPHIAFDRFCHATVRDRETGGCQMEQTGMWKLFFATGLPEAYALYRLLLETEETEKTA